MRNNYVLEWRISILFAKYCRVALPVRVEAIFLSARPRGSMLGVRMSQSGRHFLVTARRPCLSSANGGATREPIAVVDFENDKPGFQE